MTWGNYGSCQKSGRVLLARKALSHLCASGFVIEKWLRKAVKMVKLTDSCRNLTRSAVKLNAHSGELKRATLQAELRQIVIRSS